MVLLSATQAIVEAFKLLHQCEVAKCESGWSDLGSWPADLAIGDPITHTQVIAISKLLKKVREPIDGSAVPRHLDYLLRGSKLYQEPPEPKQEPTNEYKALMARLRREEEARSYERMTYRPVPVETFEQRFPNKSNPRLFADSQDQFDSNDDITYADVNRQMAMIINILLSIVACSIALWLVASRWSTPRRLALSMGGSILVAVAEAVVYAGYLRRVKEAREKGKKQVEIKEIIRTWVIGGDEKASPPEGPTEIPSAALASPDFQLRQRRTKPG
ncbi:MAG: hypothetical protein L6R36_006855 [Xanthoria steineri]|nr:MAG: hypothetical protein L6R36_006855 [Xanthoria steineri]